MNKTKMVILAHDAIIKHIGEQYFLVRASFDYSKKRLLQLTELGVAIVRFIKEARAVQKVAETFSSYANEETIEAYLSYLDENNYVIRWGGGDSDSYVNLSSLQKEIWMEEHVPYGATIELTSRCNFRCVHCYLDHFHQTEDLTFDQIKFILDALAKAGMMTIFLSGGEPLLRKDFREIYLYAKKLGFLLMIFTNGYLLDDDLLDLFLQYPPLEIDISLYGSDDAAYERVTGVKGAFTRIRNNIIKYKKHGIFVSAKTPVLTIMKDDLGRMRDVAAELDIPWRITFDITPTIDNVSKEEYRLPAKQAMELYREFGDTYYADKEILSERLGKGGQIGRRRYACGMGKSSCFIDYRGYVSPCIETRHRGVSIFENDFDTVWKKIRDISYEQLSEEENYKCLSCDIACICKSCPAVRERYYGSPAIIKKQDCAFAEALKEIILREGKR